MDIFESLESLPVSEACFNDIMSIVEEYINELKITGPALKAVMNKNYKKGIKAGKEYENKDYEFAQKQNADRENGSKDFTFLHKNGNTETDVEQEARLYPKETAELRKVATDYRQGIDRYQRARERYNRMFPNKTIKSKIKNGYTSSSAGEYAKQKGWNKVEQLYDGSIDHWGNGGWK